MNRLFREPYLRAVLGFLGITDIDVLHVEPVAKSAIAALQLWSLTPIRSQTRAVPVRRYYRPGN